VTEVVTVSYVAVILVRFSCSPTSTDYILMSLTAIDSQR
jgi:hypothetical protein